jgi:hypothetical protein
MTSNEQATYGSAFIKFYVNLSTIEELAKDIPFLLSEYQTKCDNDFDNSWKKFEEQKNAKFEALHKHLKPAGAWKKYILEIWETKKVPDFFPKEITDTDTLASLITDIPIKAKLDDFLREMSLVYLITIFESYLEDILRITFERRPQCLSSSKTVTAEEIVEKTILKESILDILIRKEIDNILRSDIEQISQYFFKKFKIDLSKLSADWNEFKERFYRRNIILHNLGVINKEYRQKTGFKGEEKRLDVSEDYLKKSLLFFLRMSSDMTDEFKDKFEKLTSSKPS